MSNRSVQHTPYVHMPHTLDYSYPKHLVIYARVQTLQRYIFQLFQLSPNMLLLSGPDIQNTLGPLYNAITIWNKKCV